jgi:hypothetical protein
MTSALAVSLGKQYKCPETAAESKAQYDTAVTGQYNRLLASWQRGENFFAQFHHFLHSAHFQNFPVRRIKVRKFEENLKNSRACESC